MIPDSLAPGLVIRAPDKTSARESGNEASWKPTSFVHAAMPFSLLHYVHVASFSIGDNRERRKVTKISNSTLQAIEALCNVGVVRRVFFAKKNVAVGSLSNAGCGTPVDLRWFILMMTYEDIVEPRW